MATFEEEKAALEAKGRKPIDWLSVSAEDPVFRENFAREWARDSLFDDNPRPFHWVDLNGRWQWLPVESWHGEAD